MLIFILFLFMWCDLRRLASESLILIIQVLTKLGYIMNAIHYSMCYNKKNKSKNIMINM